MGLVPIPRVEALKVGQSDGLVVGPRPRDTYHGRRYDSLRLNGYEAYKYRARFSSIISPLSKGI